MFLLTNEPAFPPVSLADEEGLLAIGGDLSTERLLQAYRNGIFPWYNEAEPICWWCPNPRFVLFPEHLQVSKSMQAVLQNKGWQFRINSDFSAVINHCRTVTRKGQVGTWISPAMQEAYSRLHKLGYAHSAETWEGNTLVGGLYGIRMGNVFFGESMFSLKKNASKYAFINYVRQLQQENLQLIDCQVYTAHLESLGAQMIDRERFTAILDSNIGI